MFIATNYNQLIHLDIDRIFASRPKRKYRVLHYARVNKRPLIERKRHVRLEDDLDQDPYFRSRHSRRDTSSWRCRTGCRQEPAVGTGGARTTGKAKRSDGFGSGSHACDQRRRYDRRGPQPRPVGQRHFDHFDQSSTNQGAEPRG